MTRSCAGEREWRDKEGLWRELGGPERRRNSQPVERGAGDCPGGSKEGQWRHGAPGGVGRWADHQRGDRDFQSEIMF